MNIKDSAFAFFIFLSNTNLLLSVIVGLIKEDTIESHNFRVRTLLQAILMAILAVATSIHFA